MADVINFPQETVADKMCKTIQEYNPDIIITVMVKEDSIRVAFSSNGSYLEFLGMLEVAKSDLMRVNL